MRSRDQPKHKRGISDRSDDGEQENEGSSKARRLEIMGPPHRLPFYAFPNPVDLEQSFVPNFNSSRPFRRVIAKEGATRKLVPKPVEPLSSTINGITCSTSSEPDVDAHRPKRLLPKRSRVMFHSDPGIHSSPSPVLGNRRSRQASTICDCVDLLSETLPSGPSLSEPEDQIGTISEPLDIHRKLRKLKIGDEADDVPSRFGLVNLSSLKTYPSPTSKPSVLPC